MAQKPTDSTIRGILLRKAYEKRGNGWQQWATEDFNDVAEDFDQDDLFRVTDQLAQQGLLDFKPLKGRVGQIIDGRFQITALGVNVIEGVKKPPIPIVIDQRQTFNIHGSTNFQAGNNNTQNITVTHIEAIIQQIDASNGTPEQKREAKSRLAAFLEHPLVTSIAGGAAGGLVSGLRGPG